MFLDRTSCCSVVDVAIMADSVVVVKCLLLKCIQSLVPSAIL